MTQDRKRRRHHEPKTDLQETKINLDANLLQSRRNQDVLKELK